MNGRATRFLRRTAGFQCGAGEPKRQYKQVIAATEKGLQIDPEATKAMGETRLKVVDIPKITIFQNDAARAVYQHLKRIYKGDNNE